jgi:hypothetical protein
MAAPRWKSTRSPPTNPIEAKAVIDAALEFMLTDPDRSLGIVTLNQKQRDLISEEFEYAVANTLAKFASYDEPK